MLPRISSPGNYGPMAEGDEKCVGDYFFSLMSEITEWLLFYTLIRKAV